MSHYRNYKSRFVSASSASSNSTSMGGSSSMNSVPPPPSLSNPSSSSTYQYPAALPSYGMSAKEKERQKEEEYMNLLMYGSKSEKQGRKRKIYDDDYLEREDSDDESQSRDRSKRGRDQKEKEKQAKPAQEDDEDDLDAFMAGINEQATKDKQESEKKERDRVSGKEKVDPKVGVGRTDIDDEDMQESYFKFLEEKKERETEEEEEYEYDADGNVIWTWKKVIDPLPPIDHSEIQYPDFHKNFYTEHEEIKAMSNREAGSLRQTLNLRVGGYSAPKPVCSFAHFGFDKPLMDVIIKSEYERPTPIQAQAIPAALSGRDVLGIAKTGSGKTAAYLWPCIIHIMDQPDLKQGEGPIGVIVVPTRELAIQVYQEAKRFCKAYNINVICAYGGGSKWEQSNELRDIGAEIVVCTPGRMIDLVKMEATNFLRTTFLVFDEADRMFDMGFEAQVKSISDHIRPDRQCLMFSATFKHKVERLARDALKDPVRIVQGEIGEANADVNQHVEVLESQDDKWTWLTERLVQFAAAGKVLIFVTKKLDAERVAEKLRRRDFKLVLLHGDMLQGERSEHLQSFRKSVDIMVATDVAARGLDIPEIRNVINYDFAKDIDTHVHRVGRTGRAGQKGDAYTLLTEKDAEMAGHLVRNLESVNQEVPAPLMTLALKSNWFRNQRQGGGGGHGGFNARARPGLGFKPKTRAPGSSANLDPLKEVPKPMGSGSGPQPVGSNKTSNTGGGSQPMNRLAAMKNAYRQSYASTFHSAQSEESKLPQQVASDPRPEWKRKIDEINAKFAQETAAKAEESKRKSRWQ